MFVKHITTYLCICGFLFKHIATYLYTLTGTRCLVAHSRLRCIANTVLSTILGFRVCTCAKSGPGAATARHRTRGPQRPLRETTVNWRKPL